MKDATHLGLIKTDESWWGPSCSIKFWRAAQSYERWWEA